MKKAPSVKLSLRKLMLSMLAVGPVAILPSPVWATLPTSASFTVVNGSATVVQTGTTVATITSSDRTVLQWGGGNFNIASNESYNFQMPANGAILNRVGNATVAGDAFISGQLDSNGKVFILANGNITVSSGASITTSGGLILSALPEENGAFLATGDLFYVPSATPSLNGMITIGTTSAPVNVSGNITAVAGSIAHNSSSVTGDMVLRSVNPGSAVDLVNIAAGTMLVGGNLNVSSNAGNITQAATGGAITVGNTTGRTQTATFTTNGGNNSITLSNVANDFQIIALATKVENVTVSDANIIRIAASTFGKDLTVTAVGKDSIDGTAIGTTGALAIAGNATFNTTTAVAGATANVSIGNNSTIGGTLAGTLAGNSSFTFNGMGNITTGAIVTTNGTSGGSRNTVTITTTGNITTSGTISTLGSSATTGSITLTGASINQTGGTLTAGNATRGGAVSMNATAGNIIVGSSAAQTVALRATGNISQAAGTIITTNNATGTSTINATGTAVLDNANAFASNQVLQFTGGTANLTNTAAIVVGTSNIIGNLNLTTTAGDIILGTGLGTSAQNITVGGILKATVAGANTITDGDYTRFNVFGGVDLTTGGGAVTLDAASANGSLAPQVALGVITINAGAGAATVSETTSLNLGNITAASLTANSTAGGIVDSGNLTVSGTARLLASSAGTIVLDNTGHSVGTIEVGGGNDNSLLFNSNVGVGSATNVTGNLTIATTTGRNITFAGGSVTGNLVLNSGGKIAVPTASTVTGNLSLTAADATATSITQAAALTVTGLTTIASAGEVVLNGSNNFATVTLNGVTMNTTIRDINDLTVNGTATGGVDVMAGFVAPGSVANTWNLSLGNLSVGNLAAVASNGGGGDSGTITQMAGTSLRTENNASFTTTNNNIILGNNGNNFGRVALSANSTDDSRTVTLVEDGTMKVGNLSMRGNTNLTSRFGSIIEDAAASVEINNNGALTLNSANGSVLIGNTTHTAGTTTGTVATAIINAPNGAAAVSSTGNITLGNTNVSSLTVTSGGFIAQSAALRVFGSANFTAVSNIALTTAGNNFGRVSLTTTTASRNITITEAGTLNLGAVSMPAASTGSFTATSSGGDIIDTGLTGFKPGGTTVSPGTGVVSLNAISGNIVIDDPTSDFPTTGGVNFSSKNVTLAPLGNNTLYLGSAGVTSVATGNLTVTTAIGAINSAGSLNVTGDALFQTGNKDITLAQSGNKFGTLKFTGNQVSIVESDDMVIVTGSSALGSAQLSSGGNVTILNRGGIVNFNNTSFIRGLARSHCQNCCRR